jgi:membrane-bound ClpP family serine protease
MQFFDKLEDKIRRKLSHHPVLYAAIGGIGVILFWRGIWHGADDLNMGSIISIIIGSIILLLTGVFVSTFIGSRLIISGLIGEKKLTEKEKSELETEETQLKNLQSTLNRVEKKISDMEGEVEKK